VDHTDKGPYRNKGVRVIQVHVKITTHNNLMLEESMQRPVVNYGRPME